jgi:hypothetical protein
MADLANTPTWNRALQLALQLIGILRAKRVTQEPVAGVQQDGSLVVGGGVQGQALRSSGIARGVRAGETVPVLWSRGAGRTVVPAAVLRHQTNRGGAGAAGTMSRRLVTGVVEELWVVDAVDHRGQREQSVWFRNHSVWAQLISAVRISHDSASNFPDLSASNVSAIWGFGDRMFYLAVTSGSADPYYLIYALDRAEGGPSAATPPSATFVRRVNRPNNLVVFTIDGNPVLFSQTSWRPYLGTASHPADAEFVWANGFAQSYLDFQQQTYTTAIVADAHGYASVVWTHDVLHQNDSTDGSPATDFVTTTHTYMADVQIQFWSPTDQRVAWVDNTTTIMSHGIASEAGFPSVFVKFAFDQSLEAAIQQVAGGELVGGALLWKTNAFWQTETITVLASRLIAAALDQGTIALTIGPGNVFLYAVISAASQIAYWSDPEHTVPITSWDQQTKSYRQGTIALSPSASLLAEATISYNAALGLVTPPPFATEYGLGGAGGLDTHETALVQRTPTAEDPQPWAVIDARTIHLSSDALLTWPTISTTQRQRGRVKELPSGTINTISDAHVVYDQTALGALT